MPIKFSIANPVNGRQTTVNLDDAVALEPFMNKPLLAVVPGDSLGEQFKGYSFKISGGYDNQGFPMRLGVHTNKRVKVLCDENNGWLKRAKDGYRRRRRVRGGITGHDLSMINLVVVNEPATPHPDLDGEPLKIRLGPKRANNIRKFWKLDKSDDVRMFVGRRKFTKTTKAGHEMTVVKAPKIQRLHTSEGIRRKERRNNERMARRVRSREAAEKYSKMIQSLN
eukprot:TRINITY_DN2864_c0_g1_i2.p1 TRINITY_DN2864_c0_g1~~TRINITY_DN2864_c0_g1_i2.p1  ORF type:complete len:224 (-),score=49.54 TRINITY_DN2864_c0_g1_i2:44-715(-)